MENALSATDTDDHDEIPSPMELYFSEAPPGLSLELIASNAVISSTGAYIQPSSFSSSNLPEESTQSSLDEGFDMRDSQSFSLSSIGESNEISDFMRMFGWHCGFF